MSEVGRERGERRERGQARKKQLKERNSKK